MPEKSTTRISTAAASKPGPSPKSKPNPGNPINDAIDPDSRLAKWAGKMNAADVVGKGRTIYDVGWRELISKNFVAGMSRALGAIVFQIIFLVVILGLFVQFVLPSIQQFGAVMVGTYQSLQAVEDLLQLDLGDGAIEQGGLGSFFKLFNPGSGANILPPAVGSVTPPP